MMTHARQLIEAESYRRAFQAIHRRRPSDLSLNAWFKKRFPVDGVARRFEGPHGLYGWFWWAPGTNALSCSLYFQNAHLSFRMPPGHDDGIALPSEPTREDLKILDDAIDTIEAHAHALYQQHRTGEQAHEFMSTVIEESFNWLAGIFGIRRNIFGFLAPDEDEEGEG
jgi:hypothetical protein